MLRCGDSYDVVVVGAGPAGCSAARAAAERGVSVLLVERELEVGVPDKCGEFVPALEEMRRLAPCVPHLEELFDPPEETVVNRTKYVRFVFPNGREVSIDFQGVVVERKLFDKHLANMAARRGAEVRPFTRAVGLRPGGVVLRSGGEEYVVGAKVVVGADGVFSLVGRAAGLSGPLDPMDFGVGLQYEMVNVDHDPQYVDMFLGEDIAPGTYAWIIPKGPDVANVGTGVRVPFMKPASTIRDYLKAFIQEHPLASPKLSQATPTALKAGNIPVGGPLSRTVGGNVLLVGDAGGHTIPTVGGGIPPGLIVGRVAGQVAADHVLEGASLEEYEGAWRNQMGAVLESSLRLRRMSDIVFRDRRLIEVATRLNWLTKKTINNFIYCRIDPEIRLIEEALRRGLRG